MAEIANILIIIGKKEDVGIFVLKKNETLRRSSYGETSENRQG